MRGMIRKWTRNELKIGRERHPKRRRQSKEIREGRDG